MKESKAMAKKEITFMKKKGAPKSMIKHEKAEYGMKKMAKGGGAQSYQNSVRQQTAPAGRLGETQRLGSQQNRQLAPQANIEMQSLGMKKGGMAKSGGSFRRVADGVASKGKTKGKQIKMNMGGKC